MEMGAWFEHYFPAVPSTGRGADGCWIGRMKSRTSEHNPPFYWLGRALDAVDDAGDGEVYGRRLVAAHGIEDCGGARDQQVHGVLSEACAFAWTQTHLGEPHWEPAVEGATLERGPLRLHVAAHDTYVAPARIGRHPSMTEVLAAVVEDTRAAAALLPPAHGRLIFLDAGFERFYPEHVGYRLDLTEPVEAVLRHAAADGGLGYVLTRPFQWGNPIAASY